MSYLFQKICAVGPQFLKGNPEIQKPPEHQSWFIFENFTNSLNGQNGIK